MKVVTIPLDRKTYDKLLNGSRTFDIRIDNPTLSRGDMLIYNCIDDIDAEFPAENLPFIITDKTGFDEFIEKIGSQIRDKETDGSNEIVIVSIKSLSSTK